MITDDQLAAIRDSHAPALNPHLCAADSQPWPCLTRRLVDELDSYRDRIHNTWIVLSSDPAPSWADVHAVLTGDLQ